MGIMKEHVQRVGIEVAQAIHGTFFEGILGGFAVVVFSCVSICFELMLSAVHTHEQAGDADDR